ncbi:GGDEF domain-containing protein [Alkaliphilus peptidifermentans]|uniref:Diguanylate cyclase (GGDEF) domain-containing protein n=1 Tax=Alkaliphilus peptidifermentans DSM 18978 TaxID=1120976 RepID=A0A1G5CNR8_9FIRM|nr:GGDEF domain-containing protein [Alkaliphilus peptidifermentans]SCY03890.1 diguanylate cyclase (GGDEF) domain-containing protein [Alkaliphilus peptidifermentans DSM 18978]
MINNIDGILHKDDFIKEIENKIACGTESFTLATIDIDNFETVNTYYGEIVGDEVIKKIASILKHNILSNDMVCRSNKDEFNILFDNTSIETTFIMVEEIRKYLDKHTFQLGEKKADIDIKISGGLANYPKHARNAVELFRAADSALFRAKREGKNRVCLAADENMITRSNYYTKTQLERLLVLSRKTDKTEEFLLREALDDLLDKYSK